MCVREGPYTANIGSLAACHPPPPFFEAYVSTVGVADFRQPTLHVFLNLFPHIGAVTPVFPTASSGLLLVALQAYSQVKIYLVTSIF